MSERKTKTLAEMANDTTDALAWACPRCGCRDWRVEDSYFASRSQERRRRRFCRHCKQVLHTREVPIEDIEAQREKIAAESPANSTRDDVQLTPFGIVGQIGTHDDSDNAGRSHRKRRARA